MRDSRKSANRNIADCKFFRLAVRFFNDVRWLAIWLPIALVVPNIVLSATEPVSMASALTNVLVPAGVYMLLMSLWKRTGVMTLMMLPFMVFAGFQIVLLYLYGGSVIAVDMFLNVVTTNVSEATELLANLMEAMAVVILLYVPAIIWGVYAIFRKLFAPVKFRRKLAIAGLVFVGAGTLTGIVASLSCAGYSFIHETFPLNATYNLVEACHRYDETSRHDQLAAGFTYDATPTHPADEREAYLFVIGETARGANWQLGGYERPTNPLLSGEDGAVFFPKSISESNTTHKSVPMLISFASAENFDSIAHFKSIITAFKEAGFATAFISNQEPNRSFTEHFGNEADTTMYVYGATDGTHSFDEAVIGPVSKLLADTLCRKQLIVVHTYGSHFKYYERYPERFSFFKPDKALDACADNREALVNAYDNTIRYTDFILHSLIGKLKNVDGRTALVYASDHGEDIFDDSRERFLHASPVPTYWQIHQASLVWLSPRLAADNPEMMESLRANAHRRISPQKSLFPTMMQLAGVESPMVVDSLSLVSSSYRPAPAVYLNDLNKALPLDKCGMKPADIENIVPLLR